MTPAGFIAILPEFRDVAETEIQRVLDLSVPHFNVARWDNLYDEGVANWVAHELVTAPPPGTAPIADPAGITVEMVGTVRVERATAVAEKETEDPILSSRYGRKYARLRRLVGLGGTTT